MTRVKIDKDGWCRCGGCGHKLFRIHDEDDVRKIRDVKLEIKCHSCKSINIPYEKEV